MNNIQFELLHQAINKYKTQDYDEHSFHQALETAIRLLTELDQDSIRLALKEIENELERIDFLSNDKRSDYLVEIEKIEKLLNL